ncbi:MAG: hypothetical protein ACRD6Q_06910 [Nitrososphaeraceae archaeon]|jgi:hypothetical protein|nr:hypothetical protein [Nitrososphaeraceae archaeon]
MTKFNKLFIECISEWSKKAEQCDNNECLEDCKKGLLESLDKIFPYSKDIEFEVDKVNYILSSMFFLSNRLAKATIGLAELDKSLENLKQIGKVSFEKKENNETYNKFVHDLNEILEKYF